MAEPSPHVSVLLQETVDSMNLVPGDIAVDCSAGAGGHTALILERIGPKGQVLAIDRDETAIGLIRGRFAAAIEAGILEAVHANFSEIAAICALRGLTGKVAGICADLGVSSMHLDQAERGFSFMREGPLDMRMDQREAISAASVVNEYSAAELVRILREYGEEPKAKFIADAIVRERASRPITTTQQLADLVCRTVRYKTASRKHPATRVFQALRIAVNRELDHLHEFLSSALKVLKPGGRLAVISFHSLEDRIMKEFCRVASAAEARAQIPRDLPLDEKTLESTLHAEAKIIRPFPIAPGEEELKQNPRSRSARLRVLEKTQTSG